MGNHRGLSDINWDVTFSGRGCVICIETCRISTKMCVQNIQVILAIKPTAKLNVHGDSKTSGRGRSRGEGGTVRTEIL